LTKLLDAKACGNSSANVKLFELCAAGISVVKASIAALASMLTAPLILRKQEGPGMGPSGFLGANPV